MRTIRITSLAVLFGMALIFLLITSCTKKPESIGLELVNDNQSFVGIDTTFEIRAYSTVEDSVRTDETSISLLGSRFTNVFGLSNAGFYTHLRLSQVQPDFGENPVIDSTILTIVYSNSYGNIETELNLEVHELLESFYADSNYYADSEFEISMVEMGEMTFVPAPNDSVEIITEEDTLQVAAELRIQLNNDIGNIVLDPANADSLGSNDSFINVLKGIYVSVGDVGIPGDGSILAFDLLNERSRVILYYHNDEEDSLSYAFNINLSSGRVGRFQHDYSLSTDPVFISQIVNGDTTKGAERIYLQSMAGIKTEIWFPGMADWIGQGNVAINQAKLVLPNFDVAEEDVPIPERLVLFQYLSDGSLGFVNDQLEGDIYFGGTYNEGFNDYYFRLSRYIQDLNNGSPDYGIVVYPSGKSIKAEELVIYGTSLPDSKRMKLEIIYTIVE